jgi:NAD(P)-dependent dehydrogenase (short-subunit alcohol dehydrogenase family)
MKILVVGATGTIGSAIKKLFEEKGYEVVAASRSSKPSVDIDRPSSIDTLYETVGEVDAVVVAAGNASFTSLEKMTDEHIRVGLDSKLTGQVNIVRKGLKYLKPNGVFVLTGGILAYSPWPETSLIAMVNAGLEGFAKGAAIDLKDGRRIVVVHPPLLSESATLFGMDASPWPSAAVAAKTYLDAVEGKETGKGVFVEGYAPSEK